MNFIEERILKDGVIKPGNVLKVDSFLNHQIDVQLLDEIAAEFARRFSGSKITVILYRKNQTAYLHLQPVMIVCIW